MDQVLETRVRELIDRQDIVDVLHRYCRGFDRADRALVLSAYHPDALDDHGSVVMKAADFVDFTIGVHAAMGVSHRHMISNITLEIDGDVAHGESYYAVFFDSRTKPNLVASGRYVDRFERRNGKWAIAARVCINESIYKVEDYDLSQEDRAAAQSSGPSEQNRDDISYRRPLEVIRPLQLPPQPGG